MSLYNELKRRNVFRVGIAYVVIAWLMAQVAELLLDTFESPDWILKALLVLFLIGFPFALFFAWAFEITPEGVKKEKDVDRSQSITNITGRKLDFLIIGVLVVALGYFAWDKYSTHPEQASGSAELASKSDTEAVPQSTLATDKSIAVLPFENRSNQDDDEFFTSGIHDDLLTQLAQISSLRVISRTSVAQFKGTTKSIREIAEMLGVATILEGGVQRAGNQVRINIQLIDAATDAHLWAHTYDRELTANNIFSIQSEIANSVTEAMRATLSPEERQRISSVPTENMQALEEYFKGRAELDQRTVPSIESARLRFEHARQMDPEFALAYAGEAQAIIHLSEAGTSYGDIPVAEAMKLSRPLLDRALELAPHDAQVLGVYGLLEYLDFNLDAALDYYRQSTALNPSSGEVLNWQRMAQGDAGQLKEARATSLRMVEIDPMSMITLYNGILDLNSQEDHDELTVELMLQRLEGLDKSFGLSARAGVEKDNGNIPAAIRHYYMSLELNLGRSSNRRELSSLLATMELYDEALLLDPAATDNILFFKADWDGAIKLALEDFEQAPDSVDNLVTLFSIMVSSGDAEAAFPLAVRIWDRVGDRPFLLGYHVIEMAWAATKTEHTEQAIIYHEAATIWLQKVIEAGRRPYISEAALAALDGRDNDAIAALTKSIDRGHRWQNVQTHPVFDDLQGNPAFRDQFSRLKELVHSERNEILTMLCGPDTILNSWQPAVNTCERYQQEIVK